MSRCLSVVVLSLCLVQVAAAQVSTQAKDECLPVDPKTAVTQWPKYMNMRFVEDYSGVADLPKPRCLLDSLKYIPLSDEDPTGTSASADKARMACTSTTSNFNFGRRVPNDDHYVLQRYFGHADLHLGPHLPPVR
jgi:hypothetical protein